MKDFSKNLNYINITYTLEIKGSNKSAINYNEEIGMIEFQWKLQHNRIETQFDNADLTAYVLKELL